MLDQNQQILELIKKSRNILITFGKNWDGDAVGASLGFCHFLKKFGVNADIIADRSDRQTQFSFIPGFSLIKNSFDDLRKFIISLKLNGKNIKEARPDRRDDTLDIYVTPESGFFTPEDITFSSTRFKYDLIIAINVPDLESLGRVYESDPDFFYKTPIINIDTNPGNEGFGQINLIQLTSTTVSEIVMRLISFFDAGMIDEEIATCLLAGMIIKTNSFKMKNITPETLANAAQLVSLGGRREDIVNQLYRSHSLNVLKLWGRVLARLSSAKDKKIIYSIITQPDFDKTGTDETDLPGVIEELMVNVPEARIIIIFYEKDTENGPVSTAYVYTAGSLNALELLRSFEPNGSKNLAKVQRKHQIELLKSAILEEIEKRAEKYL